ncbi:proline-rich protein 36-like [Penaeus indicus]|uniref:proline-rich protein 36-like n=1 Tax=Penaeus indicus TaxID=29960 RepID=UPI00300C2110
MQFFKCLIAVSALASCAPKDVRAEQQTDSPLDQVAAEQQQHSVQQLHETKSGAQNNSQQLVVETQHWPQRRKPSQSKQRQVTHEHSVQHIRPQRNEDFQEASQHTAQSSYDLVSPSQQALSSNNKSQPISFNIELLQSPTSAPPLAVSPLPPPPAASPLPPVAPSSSPSVSRQPRPLTFNLRPRGRRVRYRRPYPNETIAAGGASKPGPRPRYIRPPTRPQVTQGEKASPQRAEIPPGSESDDAKPPKAGPPRGAILGTPTTLSPRAPVRPKGPSAAPNGTVQRLRKVLSRQQTRSQVLPPPSARTKSGEFVDASEGTSGISLVSELTSASANIPQIAANTSKAPDNTDLPPDPRKTPPYSRVSLHRPPTVGTRGDIRPPTTTPTVPFLLAAAPTAPVIPSTKPPTQATFPNTIAAASTKTDHRTPAVVYAVTPAGDFVTTTPAPSNDAPAPGNTYRQEIDSDLPDIYTSYLAGADEPSRAKASAATSSASSNSSSPSPPPPPASTKAAPLKTSFAAPPVYKGAPVSPARVASLRNLSLFGEAPSFAPPAAAVPPSLLGLRGGAGLLGLGQAAQPQQQSPGLAGLGYLGLLSGLGGLASAPPTAGAPAFPSQQGAGLGLPLGLSSFGLGALGLGDLGLGNLGTISPLPSLEGLGLSGGLPAAGPSYGGSAPGLAGLMGLGHAASGANAGLGTVGALGSLSALGLSPGRLRDAQLNLGAAASVGSLPATPLSLNSAPDSAHAPAEGVVAPPPPAVPLGGEESR